MMNKNNKEYVIKNNFSFFFSLSMRIALLRNELTSFQECVQRNS